MLDTPMSVKDIFQTSRGPSNAVGAILGRAEGTDVGTDGSDVGTLVGALLEGAEVGTDGMAVGCPDG